MITSAVGCLGLVLAGCSGALVSRAADVDSTIHTSEVRGGLCVQLGVRSGTKQTAELAQSGRFLVHRLDNDEEQVEAARRFLQSKDLYGPMSVDKWSSKRLPYADNLVNLIIADDLMGIPREELMRVLCPDGVAYVKRGEKYQKIRKPRPEEMDEWTHQWHGPDGNLVSQDSLVGVPTGVQWLSGPLFALAGRKTSSQSLVSASGRNFYITQNELSNLDADSESPPNFLIARDAFNGLLLWKQPWKGPNAQGNGSINARIVAAGDRLYIVDAHHAVALDAATGRKIHTYPSPGTPQKIVYSNGILLVEGDEGLVALDAAAATQQWSYLTRGVFGTVVGDERVFFLVRGRAEGGERVHDLVCFDLEAGQEQWRKRLQNNYPWSSSLTLRICFARDGFLGLMDHGVMQVLSIKEGKELWNRTTGSRPGKDYVDARYVGHFFRDGLVWMRTVAAARSGDEAAGQPPGRLHLWDLATGKLQGSLEVHQEGVNDVALSPDRRTLATASGDKTVKLWDVEAQSLQATLEGHTKEVTAVAFSPDGKTLATASIDKTVVLWDAATGETLGALEGHTDGVNDVAFSLDSKTLATAGGDRTVRIWDVATRSEQATLEGHVAGVNALALSPGGETWATASDDKTVILWDTATGKLRAGLDGHTDDVNALAFSPNGKTLATASDDKTVILWDMPTGKLRVKLDGHTDDVNALAFSPDGKTLATVSDDKTVILWNLAEGERRAVFDGSTDEVNCVVFSASGRSLLTGGEGGDVLGGSAPHQLCWLGLDPLTGEVRHELTSRGSWPETATPGKMGCQVVVASNRFMMVPRQATFIDVGTGEKNPLKFFRGGCGSGAVPANGLLYVHPHACGCFSETLRGFMAVTSSGPPRWHETTEVAARLEKGPAFGTELTVSRGRDPEDWPAYRSDLRRSASAQAPVSSQLRLDWEAEVAASTSSPSQREWKLRVGNTITSPVIAGGKIFVGFPDAHRLAALEAKTGKLLWQFTAGGRIDTPPTVYRGLCLFGAHDGWVYCLRAADGESVWRFRAAPSERRIVAYGQLESAWPVAGSVLIQDGLAYVAAGRAPDADGGIYVYALRPGTGRVVWSKNVTDARYGLCDILVGDGDYIYLLDQRLDPKTGEVQSANKRARYLSCGKVGLLEASWTKQSLALRKGIQDWGYRGVTGQLLAFSSDKIFGYRAETGELFAGGSQSWSIRVPSPAQIEALILTPETLFAAGPVDRSHRKAGGGVLWSFSLADGQKLGEIQLASVPVYDGLAAADGRLYVSTQDGKVLCFDGR